MLPIFLIVLVDVLGFTIILPLLPFYSERLGATPIVVGALVSTYAVCQLISGPILGQLSDRSGRRPILLVSQAGTLLGFLLLAFSTRIWMVFLARAIDGATAGNLSIAQAYISDVTKPQNRAKSFALIGIAFGFGFTVGPALAGYLAHYGYQMPIFAASLLSLTSILCTFFLLPRREIIHIQNEAEGPVAPGGRRLSLISWGRYTKYFQNPELSRLLKQWLLFAMSFSTFVAGFALFAERTYTWHGQRFGPTQVGYVFAFNGLLAIVMQGAMVGRMVKWMGERNVVRLGFAVAGVVYAGIGFTRSIGPLLVLILIGSLASGLRPALTSLITQNADKREQGVIIGLNQSIMSVAQIVAPLIAGALISRADMHPPGGPENHVFLTLWAVWGGFLSALALLFEFQPKGGTPTALTPIVETSHA